MKRTLFLTLWATLALILVFAGSAGAQAPQPVAATLSVADGSYTVGDPIPVTLAVTHPAGYYVLPPELAAGQPWGDFVVASQSAPVTVALPDGSEQTTIAIDARLFRPGSFATPPIDVLITDSQGGLQTVSATAATATVGSVLPAGDTELRDIKGQASLPLPAAWPWLLAGLAAAALGALGFVLWKRRQQQNVDSRLPHQRALDTLAGIEAMRLPEQGRFKEHYTLVSDAVRTYIEQRFSVPARERTTGEIRADLRRAEMSEDASARIVLFLQESDLIKFSTFRPDSASAAHLLDTARLIVEATSPQPAAADAGQPGEPTARAPRGRRPASEVAL